ncbi:uracil-DNA glycosylase family protein [Natrialbaceae archaeon AArc-T1-2]|uniref:uracil-DNA glycosylase family protein n=1 Tax=Natrialbaceae archaeon AArc-T1-2 TaxID=3053904 RepID=UPI00255B200D|nr:uracil-DNA glycosylase family protein [Natrialbaceae archaeon AArc-T1-2]WIV67961.1 uracil-DNA glycosylase family protein [Natrialbaceae archaeon AArc-T1-2]
MKHVTDRVSNPFGMAPPCEHSPDAGRPVFGYGDANADFHLIGDHPGVHGGETTGVPFTGTDSGDAVYELTVDLGFASGPRNRPVVANLFASYLHLCPLPDGRDPTDEEYASLEPVFDAELRAINAHVLLPVGDRATDHVLRAYTTQRDRLDLEMADLHASEIRGRGVLVVPIREPTEWETNERETIRETLAEILASDYRQTKGVSTRVG